MATRSDRPDPDPNRPAGSGTPITPPPVTSSTTVGASGSAGGSTVSGQATITRESNTGTGDSQQYGGGGSQQYGTTITEASVPPPQIRVRGVRTVGGDGPRPIVLKVRRRGRRGGRKRYSKNTQDVQRLAYGSSKAIYRVAEGLAAGTESFWRRSNRSARRKKDGLAKDFYRNAARGVDRFSRQAGRAPWELAREISGRRSWKNLRWWAKNAPFRLGYYR